MLYGPFAAQYEAVSRGRVEQELPGGSVSTSDFHVRYHLSVRVSVFAEAEGGLAAAMVIDSVVEFEGSAILLPAAQAKQLAGATFTGPMSPGGELSRLTGDTTTTLGRQLIGRLREFFPRLPAAGAQAGAQWTDTSRTTTSSADIELAILTITRYEALGWTDVEGGRALAIRATAHYTVEGAGEQMGRHVEITGTGRRYAEHLVRSDGRYLGKVSADTAQLAATVAALAVTVPITQLRVDTLRLKR